MKKKQREKEYRPSLSIIGLDAIKKELPPERHNLAEYLRYLADNHMELVLDRSEYKEINPYARVSMKNAGFSAQNGCIYKNSRRLSSYLFQPDRIEKLEMPNKEGLFILSLVFYRVRYCRLDNIHKIRKINFDIDEFSSLGAYFISPALLNKKHNHMMVPEILFYYPLEYDTEKIKTVKESLRYKAHDIQYYLKRIPSDSSEIAYLIKEKMKDSSHVEETYIKEVNLNFNLNPIELGQIFESFLSESVKNDINIKTHDLSLGWRQIENKYCYFKAENLEYFFYKQIKHPDLIPGTHTHLAKQAVGIINNYKLYFNRETLSPSEHIFQKLSSMTQSIELSIITSMLFSFTKFFYKQGGFHTDFLTCITYDTSKQDTKFEQDLFYRAMVLLNGKETFEISSTAKSSFVTNNIFCPLSHISGFLSNFPNCIPFLIFSMNQIHYLEHELITTAKEIIIEDINEKNPIDISGIIHNKLCNNPLTNKKELIRILISEFQDSFKGRCISDEEKDEFLYDLRRKIGDLIRKHKPASMTLLNKNIIEKLHNLDVCPILVAPYDSNFQSVNGSMISLFIDEKSCPSSKFPNHTSDKKTNLELWALIKDYILYLENLSDSGSITTHIKVAYKNAYIVFRPLDVFDDHHQLMNNFTCLLSSLYLFEAFIKEKHPEHSVSDLIVNATELFYRLANDTVKIPSEDIYQSFYNFIKSLESSNRIGTVKKPLQTEYPAWYDATDASLLYLRYETYYNDFLQFLKKNNVDFKLSKKEFQISILAAKRLIVAAPMTSKTKYIRYDHVKVISPNEPRISVLMLKFKELEQIMN